MCMDRTTADCDQSPSLGVVQAITQDFCARTVHVWAFSLLLHSQHGKVSIHCCVYGDCLQICERENGKYLLVIFCCFHSVL